MDFIQFTSTAKAFSVQEFVATIKKETGAASMSISPVLNNGNGNFMIVRLNDGRSSTMPVSKKAEAGQAASSLNYLLTDDNQWIGSTSVAMEEF